MAGFLVVAALVLFGSAGESHANPDAKDDSWKDMTREQQERRRRQEAQRQAIRQQALALEREGNGAEAVTIYIRLVRQAADGKAALRLAEIYDTGIPGVPRDPAESRKWHNAARILGEEVPAKR